MKTTCCIVLICALFTITVSGQDTIFRKNGAVIHVVNLSGTGNVRTYQLTGDPDNIWHNISTTIIDSIHYASGRKEIMAPGDPAKPAFSWNPQAISTGTIWVSTSLICCYTLL
jgi:hypothetical protein